MLNRSVYRALVKQRAASAGSNLAVRSKVVRTMNRLIRVIVVSASTLNVLVAATILPDGAGLTTVTFPNTISGTSFTDDAGNVVTVGSSFSVAGGVWFGSGDLTVSFATPVTAVGFTFVNLCPNCTPPVIPNFTLIDGVVLDNGDSYDIPTGISAGIGAPASQFFGVSSATPFTTATFRENPFSSFGISDFRFGGEVVIPETDLMAPVLIALLGALKFRSFRKQ
jgi:hypothetical protein